MTENQAIGSFLGLAIGDALGTTLEFSQNPTEDRSKWHRHITGGGPFQLPAGGWTDDTSMALAMAEAIVSQGQFDANAVADNFVAWWQDGKFSCQRECFDIGFTTSEALARFNANANNANPYQGSTAPSTSGNGGIMRLVPTVIANLHDQNKAVTESVLQSRITHASPECDLYAGLLAQVLVAADPLIPEVEAYVLDDKTPWHRAAQ